MNSRISSHSNHALENKRKDNSLLAVLIQELIPIGNVLALLQPWEFPASVIASFVVIQLSELKKHCRAK